FTSQSEVVRLQDVVVNREVAVLNHPRRPGDSYRSGRVAFSANGQVLVSASADSVKVWNPGATPEKLTLLGHAGGVPGVAFSPDGKLLASASKDFTFTLWDTSTGNRIRSFPAVANYPQSVAFHPGGRILATGETHGGSVQLWDVFTGEKLAAPENRSG